MTTRRNHALWLAPLVALVALLSYFTVFVRWDATRDFPWVNLGLLALALTLAGVGLARAWPRGGWRALAGVLSALVSLGLAGFFVLYCFVFSYQLPDAGLALPVGAPVPRVQLADASGKPVDLGRSSDGRLVLVFYRGHW